MREENRFFRLLGRFNAIVLALAGTLAVVLLSLAGVSILRSSLLPRDETVPVKTTPSHSVHLELDSGITALQGTSSVVYTLRKVRDDGVSTGMGSGSYGGRYNPSQAANAMVVDLAMPRGTWLFAGETQAIWEQTFLYRTPRGDGGDVVTALVLTVADSDTDKDGTLSGHDRPSLYYYRLGDDRATKFFAATDISGVRQIDGGHLSVVFNDGKGWNAAVFSTANFQLLSKGALPRAPD